VAGPTLLQVRVSGVSALRGIIGKDMLVTLRSGSTIDDLINKLEEECGPAYREMIGEALGDSIRKRFNMLLNGVVTNPAQNLDKSLNDGDEIMFFQLAGG